LIFDIVPVKLILVILDQVLYPVVKLKPVDVVIENVVPAGGLTRPTEAKRTSELLNPFRTNPLASWEFVLYWNILEGADVID
jgi:hypothetical protein